MSLEDGHGAPSVVRTAMTRFLVVSLVAMAVLGTVTIVVDRKLAVSTTLGEAERRTAQFVHNVAAPLVDAEFRRGGGSQRATFETLMRNRMSDGSIVHAKVWGLGGLVLWSDEPELVGRSFDLGDEEAALFGTEGVISDVSSLDKVENASEAGEGPLVEVYAGAHDVDGAPLLVEAYWSADRLQEEEDAILTRTVPLSLLVLLVFQLIVLWLALRLARDVERTELNRRGMIGDALAASELERGRLAQDLHDGVIQDLTGLSYAIPAMAAQLPEHLKSPRRVLDQVGSILQRDVAALRQLLTDIYPADLDAGGLVTEVDVLAQRAEERGVVVDARVDPAVATISLDVSRLTYRVVREGLRNVVTHAHASHAVVRADVVGAEVVVRIEDDGRGFLLGSDSAAGAESDSDSEGHVGLKLLGETIRRLGGSLTMTNAPDGGALLRATFPTELAGADRYASAKDFPSRQDLASIDGSMPE